MITINYNIKYINESEMRIRIGSRVSDKNYVNKTLIF